MQDALTDQSLLGRRSGASPTITRARRRASRVAITDRYLDARVRLAPGPGGRFLEVGAGGSAWPAHVARTLGAEAWGIDFSRRGLALPPRAPPPTARARHAGRRRLLRPLAPAAARLRRRLLGRLRRALPDAARRAGADRRAARAGRRGGHRRAQPARRQRPPAGAGRSRLLRAPRGASRRESLDAAHAAGGLVPVEPTRFLDLVDVGCVNLANVASACRGAVWRALTYGMCGVRGRRHRGRRPHRRRRRPLFGADDRWASTAVAERRAHAAR